MAHLFVLPTARGLSSTVTAVSGAKAYFYDAQTSTPRATYPTAADAIAHTNAHTVPVLANSVGVWPPIYLDPAGGNYKVDLKTAAGVSLSGYPIDNLEAQELPTIDGLGEILYPRTTQEVAASVTPTSYSVPSHDALGYVLITRYGAVGDGSTDCTAALENALLVAGEVECSVLVPAGTWRCVRNLSVPRFVSVRGVGDGSELQFDNCDGIKYEFQQGFGNTVCEKLFINGVNGTTRIGLNVPGTLDDADELYGLTVRDVLISNFNQAAKFRTCRNLTIENCWFQHVQNGIDLRGKNIAVYIDKVKLTKGNGNSASPSTDPSTGLDLDYVNYTDGVGLVPPEGVQITSCQFFGFQTPFAATAGNVVNMSNCDLGGTVYGLKFATIQNGFNVTNSFIEMFGANVLAAVQGDPLGAPIAEKVNFNGVHMIGGTIGSGFIINSVSLGLQNHITIRDCFINGFDDYDIRVFNAGQMVIENNRCVSSATTHSILIDGVLSDHVYIEKNYCAKTISYTQADVDSGALILGSNTANSVYLPGNLNGNQSENLHTGAGAISLTTRTTRLATTGANALTLANGYIGQRKTITMTTDGGDGTLTPANLYGGTTLLFNDVDDFAELQFMSDGEWHWMGGTATRA